MVEGGVPFFLRGKPPPDHDSRRCFNVCAMEQYGRVKVKGEKSLG